MQRGSCLEYKRDLSKQRADDFLIRPFDSWVIVVVIVWGLRKRDQNMTLVTHKWDTTCCARHAYSGTPIMHTVDISRSTRYLFVPIGANVFVIRSFHRGWSALGIATESTFFSHIFILGGGGGGGGEGGGASESRVCDGWHRNDQI